MFQSSFYGDLHLAPTKATLLTLDPSNVDNMDKMVANKGLHYSNHTNALHSVSPRLLSVWSEHSVVFENQGFLVAW